MKIFPRRFLCSDSYGWANNPKLATMIWGRVRPKGMSWYGADLELLNERALMLYVYDIECNVRGGIGPCIHEQLIEDFTPEEIDLLDKYVLDVKTEAAEDELARREARQRELDVVRIRKELFGI